MEQQPQVSSAIAAKIQSAVAVVSSESTATKATEPHVKQQISNMVINDSGIAFGIKIM